MSFAIGLDRGGPSHAACILDRGSAAVIDRFEARHDRKGLRDMECRLARHGAPGDLPVAVERPSGLIVDALGAAGHPVELIHPDAVMASPPRRRANGAGDDRGDACLPAERLPADGPRFRPLAPPSDTIRARRALMRGHDGHVATRLRRADQSCALLESLRPGAAAICAEIDSPTARLARDPTPDSAAHPGVRRLACVLARHRDSDRRSPDERLARLRAAPMGLAGPIDAAAKAKMVRALVAVLGPLVTRIIDLTARIRPETAASEDGQIVMSVPRAGPLSAGQILAERGGDRPRDLTPDQLAADAGRAAVARRSGRSRGASFRSVCS